MKTKDYLKAGALSLLITLIVSASVWALPWYLAYWYLKIQGGSVGIRI